ncbi:MAG: bifunctional oligoribonuclease/PAP phosphatase NrnA [Acutalibacteraceae bacterium]|nr:bifunctional oligoribonuclease/PAP phosphatase NrnA [Acutalibacteraceae bacterium]
MTTAKLSEIADFLKNHDNYDILTHRYPDGDTLGSAFALCRILRNMGKRANVIVNGTLSRKMEFLKEALPELDFECETVVSVDVASAQLLGDLREKYEGRVNVSIDHHEMNTPFADMTYENPKAASNCENIFSLSKIMGVTLDKLTADCIYTGMCTDTGCFKFSNVTADTLRMAAELVDLGCDHARINREMCDTKSVARIKIEQQVLNSLTLHCDNKIAVVHTTMQMEKESGADDGDLDGIANISRQIEGVYIGITVKEKEEKTFRVSLRTNHGVNAAEICRQFGGGGHAAAAGCTLYGSLEDVKQKVVAACEKALETEYCS